MKYTVEDYKKVNNALHARVRFLEKQIQDKKVDTGVYALKLENKELKIRVRYLEKHYKDLQTKYRKERDEWNEWKRHIERIECPSGARLLKLLIPNTWTPEIEESAKVISNVCGYEVSGKKLIRGLIMYVLGLSMTDELQEKLATAESQHISKNTQEIHK